MAISIHIDWISATEKIRGDVQQDTVHPLIRDSQWVECTPRNGYTLGQKSAEGVTIYKNDSRPDMGRHIIYSGKVLEKIRGVKMLHSIDVLRWHISQGHSITRIDLAIDFKGWRASVQTYIDAFNKGECKTRLRSAQVVQSLTGGGDTLYIGSMKKRKNLVRIYDKAKELGVSGDWIRVELQIMGKKATGVSKQVSRADDTESTILGLIKSVIDFPSVGLWSMLMSGQIEVKIESIPKVQGDTELWLIKQCAPALARVVSLDVDFWFQFRLAFEEQLRLQDSDVELK